MKLKELPASLFHMFKLWRLKPEVLNRKTDRDVDVIVSLTSIPSRLNVVHHTVKSVLNQSTPPYKVVLWLHENCKPKIPRSLRKLEGNKFKIEFTDLDSPHCKLVPSLLKYPESPIITCDDDLVYGRYWLESFMEIYRLHPKAIVANHVRTIEYEDDGRPKPYSGWQYDRSVVDCTKRHIAMGYGGILYPPSSLPITTTNTSLYLMLCPKADDLWFKAMGILSNTQMIKISKPITINPIPFSQKISLKQSNVREDQNREQWVRLCEYFPQLTRL